MAVLPERVASAGSISPYVRRHGCSLCQCAAGPLCSRASAALESVQTTTGLEASRSSSLSRSSSAALGANSSAMVLEQRHPVAMLTSRVSPSGSLMVAPPPPFQTPPSAEPSVQIQAAPSGRSTRRSSHSAALRLRSGERSRRPSGPTSRVNITLVESCHGGLDIRRRSSILGGGSATSSWARVTRPRSLHPLVVVRRRSGSGVRQGPERVAFRQGGRHAQHPRRQYRPARTSGGQARLRPQNVPRR